MTAARDERTAFKFARTAKSSIESSQSF